MEENNRSVQPETKDRLKQCFAYLKSKAIVFTQQDIADRMGHTKNTISKAFNGYPKYLTTTFVNNFASIFGLNPQWILTGVGKMVDGDTEFTDPGGAAIVNNQVGNGNNFGSPTVDRFMDELAAQRELTREAQQQLTKSQEQMDRLITIIEKLKS